MTETELETELSFSDIFADVIKKQGYLAPVSVFMEKSVNEILDIIYKNGSEIIGQASTENQADFTIDLLTFALMAQIAKFGTGYPFFLRCITKSIIKLETTNEDFFTKFMTTLDDSFEDV